MKEALIIIGTSLIAFIVTFIWCACKINSEIERNDKK